MKTLARAFVLLSLAMALWAAPPAWSAYDPLAGGATQLKLDRGFLALLKRNGVELAVRSGARLEGGTISFPVVGGKFDPTSAKGVVEHEGALVFTVGHRSMPLRDLQLKTTQHRSPFSVKAGGGQLKLGSAAKLIVSRRGFADKTAVSGLKLSAKVATRLSKKLRLRAVFKEGQPLGSAVTLARPETVAVRGERKVSLVLDPGFVSKLAQLFVAVNPIFPAEHIGSEFTLPIFGGRIAPDGSVGTIETSGALEALQLGGGQVFWQDSWLDFTTKTAAPEVNVQPAPPYAGKVGRVAIADLGLAGSAVSADPGARTVAIGGVALALQASTATTLNEIFAKPLGRGDIFKAGEPLAALSLTAQAQ
jgi:hypothetical protein